MGKVTFTGPLLDLTNGLFKLIRSRLATIPFFAGSYFLYSGIADAVKLAKKVKEKNKDQEQELVPAQ